MAAAGIRNSPCASIWTSLQLRLRKSNRVFRCPDTRLRILTNHPRQILGPSHASPTAAITLRHAIPIGSTVSRSFANSSGINPRSSSKIAVCWPSNAATEFRLSLTGMAWPAP